MIKPQISLNFISNNWEEVSLEGNMFSVLHSRLLQGTLHTAFIIDLMGLLAQNGFAPLDSRVTTEK